ncbi:MAG: di-trans,poly-cis-decaprenylcistransferase [Acidobacteriaceae bacterium]|nr:di-trans,poly-cis-decaprenylcistransferase [Acidobacteriaceae bacterium]
MTQKGLHVAIIMDGNGRWATRRGLPRAAGHRAGVASIRRIVDRALDHGIGRLTLYAFSSDNWRRPTAEVQGIFWLLRAFLRLETNRLRQRGVRLQAIGRRDRLAPVVHEAIEKAELSTAAGDRLDLCVAIDYSSREAIARAAAGMALSVDETMCQPILSQRLMRNNSDVDLLIRTGGEKRLSDFLLWESAYAELYFTDCMWPDFDEAEFDAALEEFYHRDRRFGGLSVTAPDAAASTHSTFALSLNRSF